MEEWGSKSILIIERNFDSIVRGQSVMSSINGGISDPWAKELYGFCVRHKISFCPYYLSFK